MPLTGSGLPAPWLARLQHTFRSLQGHNYRLWAAGAVVSNIGTWMQRIAQDWLVLTELSAHSGTSVGVVMSLQFGPPILLMPLAGYAADHLDRRRLLIVTQTLMALLAMGLGLLTLWGHVTLGWVYGFAGLLGCVAAFDAPARQTFVAELVGDEDLPNAVALNSTLFNSAQLIGPAVAGVLIAVIGTGWVFLLNAASFVGVIAALAALRRGELRQLPRPPARGRGLADGFRYIGHRPDLIVVLTMLFVVATYGLNFPIFISTMSVTTFAGSSHLYGILSSTMALGSVLGALLSASRTRPSLNLLRASALALGLCCAVAALMPTPLLFGLTLVAAGVLAQTFTTSANSLVQLSTDPTMRGRVMAIYMGIFLGCTPLGAPLVGWVADRWGPRWGLGVGAASGLLAALLATWQISRHRRLAPSPSAPARPDPKLPS